MVARISWGRAGVGTLPLFYLCLLNLWSFTADAHRYASARYTQLCRVESPRGDDSSSMSLAHAKSRPGLNTLLPARGGRSPVHRGVEGRLASLGPFPLSFTSRQRAVLATIRPPSGRHTIAAIGHRGGAGGASGTQAGSGPPSAGGKGPGGKKEKQPKEPPQMPQPPSDSKGGLGGEDFMPFDPFQSFRSYFQWTPPAASPGDTKGTHAATPYPDTNITVADEHNAKLDKLITGLAAAAVGLPGLLLGRMPIAARVLWRALAYGSPAAYVAAAVGTRLLVRRIKAWWGKRRVRDQLLDAHDREYVRLGGILAKEANHVLCMASLEGEGSRLSEELRAALEEPYRPGRREGYVARLLCAVPAMSAATLTSAAKGEGVASLQPPVVLGQLVVLVRLGDALCRVCRDALLASARRVQQDLRYWDSRHRPGWTANAVSRVRSPMERRSLSEERKSPRQCILELQEVLDAHVRQVGLLQSHLLTRPSLDQASTSSVISWSLEALARAQNATSILTPEVDDEEPSDLDPDHVARWLKRGVGKWAPQWLSQRLSLTTAANETAVEPLMAAAREEGKGADQGWAPVSLDNWGPRANATLTQALGFRDGVSLYVEQQGLGRPKLSRWVKFGMRVGWYLVALRALNEVWERRSDIRDYAVYSRDNMEEFLNYRFVEPGRAILNDLILNKRQRLTDAGAIEDAKASLQRMLSDFIADTYPGMSPSDQAAIVRDMDISVVSGQYDKEIRSAVRNVFSGKIVRMLLIQIQFIKKELLAAMEAIDDLFNANKVNLQIFAVVPALFTTWVLYRVVVYVVGVLSSRRIYSTAGVHRALRHSLRDMERLLTLAPRLLPPHTGASLLDEQGLGWLVLHLTDFHTIVRVNAARLDKAVRRTLVEEDLTDLLTGRQTLEQQLASLNRIRRSYGFLQVRSNGPLFEFIT